MRKPTPKKNPRHCFEFTVQLTNGTANHFKSWAKIIQPKRAVHLIVTADDVRRSIEAHGANNTQTCTMAFCVRRHRSLFDHNVEDFIDWQYRTAFIVTKLGKNGLPIECARYVHNNRFAHLNDTPGGQRKLLQLIESMGGAVRVVMRPRKSRKGTTKTGGTGKRDGTRSTALPMGMGAKRRFAVAHLGLVAPTPATDAA